MCVLPSLRSSRGSVVIFLATASGRALSCPGVRVCAAQAERFVEEAGLPIIIKAAFGGGGRGMRVVQNASELQQMYESASNEALTAFGDGSVFIERYVDSPRHVEVQSRCAEIERATRSGRS